MIFKRRSIKKYKKELVPEQLKRDILYFGDCVSRLYGDIQVKMEICDSTENELPSKGLWKVDAPYYLILYSEEKEGYLVNAGYVAEPVLLYMTGKGLGTCYLANAKSSKAGESVKNILKAVRLSPSIMNTQPWRFIVYHDKIYVFSCREFLPYPYLVSLREISVGIMLSHLNIAAEEMWINVSLETDKAMEKKSYKSGAYVATAYLKEYKL